MITISRTLLGQIVAAAEAAYPDECCGLLVGQGAPDGALHISRVVNSPNVSQSDRRDSFEVDPEIRFRLMRELGEIGDKPKGADRIVGHYHSHPDHPAAPSARDLEMAYEPELVWVIAGLDCGRVTRVTAHLMDVGANEFREIPLHTP